MLGAQYKWGGNDPKTGIDCSGLVCYYLKKAGAKVGDTTADGLFHSKLGAMIDTGSPDSWREGDILFFNRQKGVVKHTAVYLGNGQILNASSVNGRVEIDRITPGSWYARQLVGVRRFVRPKGK